MLRYHLKILSIIAILCCTTSGLAQDLVSVLKPKLEGAQLELRTPAPEVKLTYDSTGTLKRKSNHGLRSIDAFLLVKKIKLKGQEFSIEGERLAVVWNQKEQHAELTLTSVPVHIAIDLTNRSSTDERDFTEQFHKIFIGSEDAVQRECSVEEQRLFAEVASLQIDSREANRKDHEDEAPPKICFPGGNRVLRVGKGVQPPKPVKAEDPHYSNKARRGKIQGKNIFLVAIDEEGRMSDALMVRSLEPTLNYESLVALRNWIFKPAEFDGKAVACTVNVEINYQLY